MNRVGMGSVRFALIAISLCAIRADASGDTYVGEWLLTSYSASSHWGNGVAGGEMTLALRISKKGNFYGVALDIPTKYADVRLGGFSWEEFLKRSDASIANLTVGAARKKYTGEYLMDVDGASIENQISQVTFSYRPGTGMLCETGLGCFSRGSPGALIENYKKREQEKADADARAIAEGKARLLEQVKSLAEAKARAKAEAEAEARRPRPIVEARFEIDMRQDKFFPIELESPSHIEFQVSVIDGPGRSVRVALLDLDGLNEWRNLKYGLSPFSRPEKKNASQVRGPCSDLLGLDVAEKAAGACDLAAGTYYVVFYDAYWAGRTAISRVEATVAFRATSQPNVPDGKSVSVPGAVVAQEHPAVAGYYEVDTGESEPRVYQSSARFANVEYDVAWSALIGHIAKTPEYKFRMKDIDAGVIHFFQPKKDLLPPVEFEIALHEVGTTENGIQIDLKLSVPRPFMVTKGAVIREFSRLMDVARGSK